MTGRSVYAALTSITLLAAWLGVAVFIAAVLAPAAFAVLPSRALAGALVGRALPVLFVSGIALGALVTAMYATSDRVTAIGGFILLLGSVGAMMIERRLHNLLVEIGAPIDTLAMTDPRRMLFGRLHGISVLLMGIAVIGASVAVVTLARHIHAGLQQPRAVSAHSDAVPRTMASPLS